MLRPREAEAGVALIVALVFLVAITALVLAGIKMNITNTRMVGNVQHQAEMEAAADAAINRVIGDAANFSATPGASITIKNTSDPIDPELANLRAKTTVVVASPNCLRAEVAPGYSARSDTSCEGCSGASGVGVDDTEWDVQATVSRDGDSVIYHQGVAVRLPAGNCPP